MGLFYPEKGEEIQLTAIPTEGWWKRGQKIYFTEPTAGGSLGAVCVTSGTPGTWKTFGAIEA
jgi:hypothetical protein